MPINIVDAIGTVFKTSGKLADKYKDTKVGSRIIGGLEKAIRGIGSMFGIDAIAEATVGQPTRFHEFLGEVEKQIAQLQNISADKLEKLDRYLAILDSSGYNLSGVALKNLQKLKKEYTHKRDAYKAKSDELVSGAEKMRTQLAGLTPQSNTTLIKEEEDISKAFEKATDYMKEANKHV